MRDQDWGHGRAGQERRCTGDKGREARGGWGQREGRGVPRGEGGSLGRCSRACGRAPGTQAGREPGSTHGPAFPTSTRCPSAERTQAPARSGRPAFPLRTHLRRQSHGSRPRPQSSSRALLRAANAEQGCRGPRPRGRSEPRACAGGRRRERAQHRPARHPRRALSGWEGHREAPSAPTHCSPALPNWIGPQRRLVPPLISLGVAEVAVRRAL